MPEYIERGALMKNFCGYDLTKCVKYGNKDAEQQHDSYSTMMMYEIADEIEDASAADVAPVRHGRWISLTECANAGVYCSVCNKKVYKEDYAWSNKRIKMRSNFCPNCGAKMDLEG